MQALSVVSDAELARSLGITPQSVCGARKRGEVPPAWIQTCAAQTGVNAHWLFFWQRAHAAAGGGGWRTAQHSGGL